MLGKLTWGLVKNGPRLAALAAGAGLAWSATAVDHSMPLGPALPGDRLTLPDGAGGSIMAYRSGGGSGVPVLLVHSVNAAASAYEMRPLFTGLQAERPVWAIDLPGFGDSDRSDRRYTPALMTSAVAAALDAMDTPAHLVGSSLGCEFAAAAAVRRPEAVRSLALLSPTGFGPGSSGPGRLGNILRFPLWAQAAFDAIASRRSIRYFLGKSFTGPVDELLADHAYRTAHQPGARHAPLAFLAGDLFTTDAPRAIYQHVEAPTVVLYDRDPFSDFARLPEFIADRPGWSATRIPDTSGLPHWDRPDETLAALHGHWAGSE